MLDGVAVRSVIVKTTELVIDTFKISSDVEVYHSHSPRWASFTITQYASAAHIWSLNKAIFRLTDVHICLDCIRIPPLLLTTQTVYKQGTVCSNVTGQKTEQIRMLSSSAHSICVHTHWSVNRDETIFNSWEVCAAHIWEFWGSVQQPASR